MMTSLHSSLYRNQTHPVMQVRFCEVRNECVIIIIIIVIINVLQMGRVVNHAAIVADLNRFRRYVVIFSSTSSIGIIEDELTERLPSQEDWVLLVGFSVKELPGTRPLIALKDGTPLVSLGSSPMVLNFAALKGLTVFHSLQDVQRPTHLMCSTPHWSQKNISLGLFDGDAFMPDRDDIDNEVRRDEKIEVSHLNWRLPTTNNNDTRIKTTRLPVMMKAVDCILVLLNRVNPRETASALQRRYYDLWLIELFTFTINDCRHLVTGDWLLRVSPALFNVPRSKIADNLLYFDQRGYAFAMDLYAVR